MMAGGGMAETSLEKTGVVVTDNVLLSTDEMAEWLAATDLRRLWTEETTDRSSNSPLSKGLKTSS